MSRDAILRHVADAEAQAGRWRAEGFPWLAVVRERDAAALRRRLRGLAGQSNPQ